MNAAVLQFQHQVEILQDTALLGPTRLLPGCCDACQVVTSVLKAHVQFIPHDLPPVSPHKSVLDARARIEATRFWQRQYNRRCRSPLLATQLKRVFSWLWRIPKLGVF